jgi:hypothetical protein
MKKEYEINWYAVAMVGILVIAFVGLVIHGIYGYITYEPNINEVDEGYQRTIEYVGFDGKKHQAIVIKTAQHNWVLVEKR